MYNIQLKVMVEFARLHRTDNLFFFLRIELKEVTNVASAKVVVYFSGFK